MKFLGRDVVSIYVGVVRRNVGQCINLSVTKLVFGTPIWQNK